MAIEVKISQLPNAEAVTGTEKFPAVQAAATVAPTLAQVRTYTDVTASGFAAGAQASAIATASGYAVDSLNTAITVASGYAVDAMSTAIATASGYTELYTNGKVATLSGYVDARLDPIEDFKAYDATRTYALNDPTFYAGVPYKSLSAGNVGHQPDTSPTYWEVTGGGSGIASVPGVNYDNGQFENKLVLGYSTYVDAAQDTPVDGTGGTPNVTFTHSTTTPLIGVGSGVFTKDAVNRQGQGVSYDFTIDRGKTIMPMMVDLFYETDTNYASRDIGVFLYDKTNANLIPLSVNDLPATNGKPAQFKAAFIPSTSTEYRLIFHVRTTNALAYTLKLDDIEIGDKHVASGSAISEWEGYTPVIEGFGTVTALTAYWRRVGSSMEIRVRGTAGTPTATLFKLYLPGGYTIKSPLSLGLAGHLIRNNSVTSNYDVMSSAGRNYLTISSNTSNSYIELGGNGILAAGELFSLIASVPIAQWTSNVNLAEDFTEYAYNYSTTATEDLTSFGYGTEGALIQAFAPTGLSSIIKRVKFQRPIQPSDLLVLELKGPNTNNWVSLNDHVSHMENDAGTVAYGTIIYFSGASSAINAVEIYFYSKASPSQLWSAFSTYRWRVRKVSNGNMAEVPPLVRAEYIAGSSAAGAIINYTTKVEDTHNAVTVGAGTWKFTAPISGVYSVEGMFYASIAENVFLLKNGTTFRNLKYGGIQMVDYSISIRLLAGEYIGIQSGSATSNIATPWIAITRIGS